MYFDTQVLDSYWCWRTIAKIPIETGNTYKHYKITDEDFRNRVKWNDYELATNEMIERTGTEFAPWYTIAANDKKFARIKVVKTLCDRLKKSL